jgi:hypothetical protein
MRLHVQDRNGLRLGPDGEPIVLMPQLTGIETVNMQFFPVNPDLGKPLDNAQSVAVDRGLTFIPQDVYTTATVPEGKKYAMYLNGKCIRYNGETGHHVQASVRIAERGKKVIRFSQSAFDAMKGRFKLPKGTVFVKINETYRPETKKEWGMK